MNADQLVFDELSYYTLAHGDPSFIHQHAVDAFAAQTATENDKPIKLTFALVGLYLHVEKRLNGRQVQLAHMKLARYKQTWPVFELPADRGTITVHTVLAGTAGHERDRLIYQWCQSVWEAFRENRPRVQELVAEHQLV